MDSSAANRRGETEDRDIKNREEGDGKEETSSVYLTLPSGYSLATDMSRDHTHHFLIRWGDTILNKVEENTES
jgi:hypothetical protein